MDYGFDEAIHSVKNERFFLWVGQRKENLLSEISAHDILRHFGVTLRYGGSDHEEQICCPFHGDSDPSARVYPASGEGTSGVYCYVCRKRWDIFRLWAEFNGNPTMKFTSMLLGLEKAFGIATPEAPDMERAFKPSGPSESEVDLMSKLKVCESRLRKSRRHFTLEGFLLVGKALDILHYKVKSRSITSEAALSSAQLILDKIAEKSRCA